MAEHKSEIDLPFYVLLFSTLGGFVALSLPFVGVLLAAAVIVVIAWPMHQRILSFTRGRRLVATLMSFGVLAAGLLTVGALLAGIVIPELGRLSGDLTAALQVQSLGGVFEQLPVAELNRLVTRLTGDPFDVSAELLSALQSGLGAIAATVASAVPTLLQVTGMAVLQSVVFLLALGTFLGGGAELVAWIRRLSPLQLVYSERLMNIFASFSRNVVLASIVGAFSQGIVAGIGYVVFGVERAPLFAVLSGCVAVVPFVGTALVWVPLSGLLFAQGHHGAALGLVIWNVALTSSVDNVVKPLVVRGSSDLPPLLVFLGVFGGLKAMGLVGLLVGPVLVAMMMALIKIYDEQRVAATEAAPPSDAPASPPASPPPAEPAAG